MRKLNTFVHVHDDQGKAHVFGPDDEVPAWAAEKITNEGVWAVDIAADTSEGDGGTDGPVDPAQPGEPPRTGKGSGLAAWAGHATDLGITLEEGMKREDIIAAVDAHHAAQVQE